MTPYVCGEPATWPDWRLVYLQHSDSPCFSLHPTTHTTLMLLNTTPTFTFLGLLSLFSHPLPSASEQNYPLLLAGLCTACPWDVQLKIFVCPLYITDVTKDCVIKTEQTHPVPLMYGVLHRSMLGPVLFNMPQNYGVLHSSVLDPVLLSLVYRQHLWGVSGQ